MLYDALLQIVRQSGSYIIYISRSKCIVCNFTTNGSAYDAELHYHQTST